MGNATILQTSLGRTPHGEATHTVDEWAEHYSGQTWNQIAYERGEESYLKGLITVPLGPITEWRYVSLSNGYILDMRHVLIVGMKFGQNIGMGIEIGQFLTDINSFNQMQDYFSNFVGEHFSNYLKKNSFYYNPKISNQTHGNIRETNISNLFKDFIHGR